MSAPIISYKSHPGPARGRYLQDGKRPLDRPAELRGVDSGRRAAQQRGHVQRPPIQFVRSTRAARLPQQCFTVSVSPMLREMILRLADVPVGGGPDDHVDRLLRVLLDELV